MNEYSTIDRVAPISQARFWDFRVRAAKLSNRFRWKRVTTAWPAFKRQARLTRNRWNVKPGMFDLEKHAI